MAILKQDQDSVTAYFSKLKALWDEYASYRPACTCGHCTCGGSLLIEKFVQLEYLLNFLMGLNDNYGHSRSQIILMDPPPPISIAFYLIAQEEEQNTDVAAPAISLAVGSSVGRNGNQRGAPPPNRYRGTRPSCTHCGFQGHTVDKFYKHHGYPPGYRTSSRGNTRFQYQAKYNSDSVSSINQASTSNSANAEDTLAQCHNILTMLQSKLAGVKSDAEDTTSYLAGNCSKAVNDCEYEWVIDSGASTHICCSRDQFV